MRSRSQLPLVAGLFCLLGLCLFAGPTAAAGPPYELDRLLSLTGDCSKSAVDPVPDPGCPDPPHPPSGPFDEPTSIAIDSYGNEYVASSAGGGSEGRIDVFDHEGRFITELLAPLGPKSIAVDSKGNLYVYEQAAQEIARYAPTIYEPIAGKIEYGNPRAVVESVSFFHAGLAIDLSNDHLFAAQGSFIAEFGSAVEGNKLLNTITHEKLGSWSTWVAVDAERRRLFASYCKTENTNCGVLVLEADAPHALLKEIDGSNTPAGKFASNKGWLSTAVDEETGRFFIDDLELSKNIYEFDENYEFYSKLTFGNFQGGLPLQIAVSNSPLRKTAKNRHYLFVPVALNPGPVFAFKPPKEQPPKIESLSATHIGETEATLQGAVDPRGADTNYVFEYVSEQQFEESGFVGASIGGEGKILLTDISGEVTAIIDGLVPGESYRFRLRAENVAGKDEEESVFATYSDAPVSSSCPNQGLRTEASALLPDCRAYELVTPPDTNGRPPKGAGFEGEQFGMVQSSPLGGAVSFRVYGGTLPGTDGSGGLGGDPYLATRGTSGWTSAAAGPSGAEGTVSLPGASSPDQGYSFWDVRGEGSAVIEDNFTRYVRYPDGHSELIGRGSLGTDPRARGKLITENGSHIVFQTVNVTPNLAIQLEPDAPPTGTGAVYDRTADGVTHVVSLLPGDQTPAAGQHARYVGASRDGAGIVFAIDSKLYLRVDNAVTYEIGGGVTFAGVSEGGERIFYVESGDLFAFDTEAKEELQFTETGDAVVVNVAPDGTRAYFVSADVIPGAGQNPNGASAKAGQQNLYLSEEGAIRFVATVTARDVEGTTLVDDTQADGLGLWTDAVQKSQLARDPSRVTPDGTVLLFQSRANLDSYDPQGFAQVYRYDSVGNRLHCISCIPTRLPATGGASLETFTLDQFSEPPFSPFGFVPNLRSDGRRVFFQSTEALVSYDTDEVQDVYQWEEQGVGSCTRPGGCVYLITSGRSGRDNYIFGHSENGDDVFFTTADILTRFDASNTSSIYDARVNGGFPYPEPTICDGEGCRPGIPTPAPLPESQSGVRQQSGNVSPPKPRRCGKGKRKVKRNGKVRCVKKKKRAIQKKRADRDRRAGTNGRAAR